MLFSPVLDLFKVSAYVSIRSIRLGRLRRFVPLPRHNTDICGAHEGLAKSINALI